MMCMLGPWVRPTDNPSQPSSCMKILPHIFAAWRVDSEPWVVTAFVEDCVDFLLKTIRVQFTMEVTRD